MSDENRGLGNAHYYGPTTPVREESHGLYSDHWWEFAERAKLERAEATRQAFARQRQAEAAKAEHAQALRNAVSEARKAEALAERRYLQHRDFPPYKEAWLAAIREREQAEQALTAP